LRTSAIHHRVSGPTQCRARGRSARDPYRSPAARRCAQRQSAVRAVAGQAAPLLPCVQRARPGCAAQ
jgi:hypothetical protein